MSIPGKHPGLLRFFPALLLAVVLGLLVSCAPTDEQESAKNVIFINGDGMGASHRAAIRLSAVGERGELEMDRLPEEGMVGTHSADSETFITDSAASATAMASGVKTYNGAIGMNLDREPVPTVLERAQEMGKASGLVTTSTVTDATPAAFAAHVEDRGQRAEIARQYIQRTGVDVILGGGRDLWAQEGEGGGSLVQKARGEGYSYVTDAGGLEQAGGGKILGLFTGGPMYEGDPGVSLPQMTRQALDTLSQDEDGFFLVVEEEAIDSMSHGQNASGVLEAGKELDGAVGFAREYAGQNQDTLLISTADHETGGLSVEQFDGGEGEDGPFQIAGSEQQFAVDWTTDDHTGARVPLTATGPGAQRLSGTYENTRIHEVILQSITADD